MTLSKVNRDTREPDGPLWEKWPDEQQTTYEFFAAYRDLPVRSLRTVAKQVGRSYQTILEHSRRWQWGRRVREYDAAIAREVSEKNRRDLVRMRKRYAKSAKRLHHIADRGIRAWIENLETLDPSSLDIVILTKVLDVAEKLEARSRGRPEDNGILASESEDDDSGQSREELARLLNGIRAREGTATMVTESEPEAGS